VRWHEARVTTPTGTILLRRSAGQGARVGLFIHGLGCDGSWFEDQAGELDLGPLPWLVPDLLGHGRSACADDPEGYRIESQAQALAEILATERCAEVVLVGHSMGGPIALRLAEMLMRRDGPRVAGLIYAEGNLDRGDAFMSARVADQDRETFLTDGWDELLAGLRREPGLGSYLRTLEAAGPLVVHASCISLVEHSRPEVTVPRLSRLDCPKLFLFGERNRGRFSSEALAASLGTVRFVPDAGHAMHEDNPREFWALVRDFCSTL
jgi:haloalkane dehalogenase